MFSVLFSFLLLLPILIFPFNVFATESNIDLSSAQTSVGKRFAKVFCEAKTSGLNSETASEYALNNTYLKFVAFPDDKQYLEDLWTFTSEIITDSCGDQIDMEEIEELESFFKEEAIIASNRDLYLPTFENN